MENLPHTDFQKYYKLDSAKVNGMIQTLENKEFIKKDKGKARSIELVIDKNEMPELDVDPDK